MPFDVNVAEQMALAEDWGPLYDYMLEAAMENRRDRHSPHEIEVLTRVYIRHLRDNTYQISGHSRTPAEFLTHYYNTYVKSTMTPEIKSLRAKYKAINRSNQVDDLRRDLDSMLSYADDLCRLPYQNAVEEGDNPPRSLLTAADWFRNLRGAIRSRQPTDEATLRNFLHAIGEAVARITPIMPALEQLDDPAATELDHVRDYLDQSLRTQIGVVLEAIQSQHANDNTALRIAVQMDRDHDYSAAPILADALEDAGFNNQDVLRILRTPGHSSIPYTVRNIAGRGTTF